MNTDFIKWLVGYAEGFGLKEKGWIETPGLYGYDFELHSNDNWINPIDWKKIYYPLLLQRAIEGITNSVSPFFMAQNCDFIIAYEYGGKNYNHFSIIKFGIDEAKKQALKYIYEQKSSC